MRDPKSNQPGWAARVYRRLRPRAAVVLAIAAALLTACAVGAIRLAPRHDAHTLVAGPDSSFAHAARLLGEFGTLDTLLVDLSAPSLSRETLEQRADEVARRLRETGAFRSVLFRVSPERGERLAARLFARRFHLFPLPSDLSAGAAAAQRDLMLPGGALESIVTRDPVGHRHRIAQTLTRARPALDLDASRGTLTSRDGEHALVVLDPIARAMDVTRSAETLALIAETIPDGVQSRVLGAHVFVTSAAQSVKRDVWLTVSATALCMLVLFALVFRGLGPVLAVTLPVAGGGVVAAGLIGWLGLPIHGITLGFGAIMIGIGVDYSTHLVMHVRARRRAHPEDPLDRCVEDSLSAVAPSISMGAATTLAAFAALALGGTAALGQIVLFTGLGIGASFALCMIVLPQMLGLAGVARASGRRPSWRRAPNPRLVLAIGAASTLLLGYGALRVGFDGDVRRFDYQPPEVRALEAELAERWSYPRHPTLIVASGADRQQALRRADRVCELLETAVRRQDISSFSALCRVLPSAAKQRRALESYSQTGTARRLREALEAAELLPAAFEPFHSELASTQRGDPGPLDAEDLEGTPFEPLVQRMLVDARDGQAHALAVAYNSEAARKELPPALRDALAGSAGTTVVSAAGLAKDGLIAVKNAVVPLSLVSVFLVGLVLLVYYRRAAPALLALLPTGVAFVWTWGVMGWLQIPLDIVSIGAFAMVCGIGVDYGIFVVDAALSGAPERVSLTRRAVLMASATTLASFSALLLANSPVMWSLGFAVTVGVATSVAGALLVLPALLERHDPLQVDARARCEGCGRRPVPASDRWAWFQLASLLTLGGGLAVAWLMGARATGGAQTAGILIADAVWIAWLAFRLQSRPLTCHCV